MWYPYGEKIKLSGSMPPIGVILLFVYDVYSPDMDIGGITEKYAHFLRGGKRFRAPAVIGCFPLTVLNIIMRWYKNEKD